MSASAVWYPLETWKTPTLSSVPAGKVAGLIVTAGFCACWPLFPWNAGENDTACEKPLGAASLEQKLPVVTLAGMPYWARSLCSALGSNSTFGLMVGVAVPLVLRVIVKAAVRIVVAGLAGDEPRPPDRPRPSTTDPAAAAALTPASAAPARPAGGRAAGPAPSGTRPGHRPPATPGPRRRRPAQPRPHAAAARSAAGPGGVMAGSLGVGVGIDGVRDDAVGAPCLVLVDERGAFAVVAHPGHQVAQAPRRLPPRTCFQRGAGRGNAGLAPRSRRPPAARPRSG
jgi:hypothetical protein